MPKISAIITTWNRVPMLERAIKSVLAQTFRDIELLVLDNGSSDNTGDVVRGYEKKDKRIRYIRHAPNSISWARNLGIKEARGEFIGFLDDDDEWLPDKLADEMKAFEGDSEKKIGLVYGAYVHINQATGKTFETIYPKFSGATDVYGYAISHRDTLTGSASNPLLRKSAILAVGGYDENIKTGEDYEMFLRLARRYLFAGIPKPVLKIYVHEGYRLSYRLEDYLHTELTVYRKHIDFIGRNPDVNVFFLRIIAGKLLRLGRPKEAREYLLKALRLMPFDFLAFGQCCLSYLPVFFYAQAHRAMVNFHHHIERKKRAR